MIKALIALRLLAGTTGIVLCGLPIADRRNGFGKKPRFARGLGLLLCPV